MLGPDVGGDRRRGLVAVAVRARAGAGINAQVRVDVDQPRRDPLAAAVDADRSGGRGEAGADGGDLAVLLQHVGAVPEIGRAWCRVSVCLSVLILVVAVYFKKNN